MHRKQYIQNLKLKGPPIRYIDVVKVPYEIEAASRWKTLIFNNTMLETLNNCKGYFSAEVICMQEYQINSLLKNSTDLPEMLKTSVSKFILYNNWEKYFYDGKVQQTSFPIENLKNLDLIIEYATENFMNLQTIEVSLFGFSASKFEKILEIKTDKSLNIDL